MNPIQSALSSYFRSRGQSLAAAEPPALQLALEPFLDVNPDKIINPLTNKTLTLESEMFATIRQLEEGAAVVTDLDASVRRNLFEQGWLVNRTGEGLSSRFRLKYVSLEGNTDCNQKCYFCPVSVAPRASHTTSIELSERIVRQLAEHRATIEGVSMIQYNEPTIDAHFLDRIRILKDHGLPPAVLSNGSALTPQRVDAIIAAGGLHYLSVNLSTLDPERYAADRGHDHLRPVLRNLEYPSSRRIAPLMIIVVLGQGDAQHKADFDEIQQRYANTPFEVKYYEVMNRSGAVEAGHKPPSLRSSSHAAAIRRARGRLSGSTSRPTANV